MVRAACAARRGQILWLGPSLQSPSTSMRRTFGFAHLSACGRRRTPRTPAHAARRHSRERGGEHKRRPGAGRSSSAAGSKSVYTTVNSLCRHPPPRR
jgi:hypothetical protein